MRSSLPRTCGGTGAWGERWEDLLDLRFSSSLIFAECLYFGPLIGPLRAHIHNSINSLHEALVRLSCFAQWLAQLPLSVFNCPPSLSFSSLCPLLSQVNSNEYRKSNLFDQVNRMTTFLFIGFFSIS